MSHEKFIKNFFSYFDGKHSFQKKILGCKYSILILFFIYLFIFFFFGGGGGGVGVCVCRGGGDKLPRLSPVVHHYSLEQFDKLLHVQKCTLSFMTSDYNLGKRFGSR